MQKLKCPRIELSMVFPYYGTYTIMKRNKVYIHTITWMNLNDKKETKLQTVSVYLKLAGLTLGRLN